MSIIRAPRPESGWTAFANDVCRDERISDKARGLLLRMLSHADNYRFSSDRLAYERTGRDAIQSALRELEAAGYVRRMTTRDERGRIITTTFVYDVPSQPDLPARENPPPDYPPPDSPGPEKPSPKEVPSKERPSKDQDQDQELFPAHAGIAEIQIPDRFEEFWKAYPRHAGSKKKARLNWQRAIKGGADPEQIIAGAAAYAEWLAHHPDPPRLKHAEGWLTDERWESDLPPYPQAASPQQRYKTTAQTKAEERQRMLAWAAAQDANHNREITA